MTRLAIDGGTPVRTEMLPYGHHVIEDSDVDLVVETLRSDWITTGPRVEEFERALSLVTGASHVVSVSSGTAALHAMLAAGDVGPGDEVIVPVITFAATANAVLYVGARPVFVDVDATTLLISPDAVDSAITVKTKAVIPVDFAGQPCDYDALRVICDTHNLLLLADSCHALGAGYRGTPVGSLADMTAFSFHPVKHVATGEGGAVATGNERLAATMRRFRNHGITTDAAQRQSVGTWFYEMTELGFNYRLSDLNCALGISQLKRLCENVTRRQAIAARYDGALNDVEGVSPLLKLAHSEHAYHLYVALIDDTRFKVGRAEFFTALRAENIGVNVHYIPVPWHPYYRDLGYERGAWPHGEAAYERMLTLPIWPGMSDRDADDVIEAVGKVARAYLR